jgi:hypothetical protein
MVHRARRSPARSGTCRRIGPERMDGGLNWCMGFLPARHRMRALTGRLEWLAATQARFYADGGGWTLKTRIRWEQPRRRGLPGVGCAIFAVQQRAGTGPIRVFSVYPFCICVEACLLCRVPHRCRAGRRWMRRRGLGDVPRAAAAITSPGRETSRRGIVGGVSRTTRQTSVSWPAQAGHPRFSSCHTAKS